MGTAVESAKATPERKAEFGYGLGRLKREAFLEGEHGHEDVSMPSRSGIRDGWGTQKDEWPAVSVVIRPLATIVGGQMLLLLPLSGNLPG